MTVVLSAALIIAAVLISYLLFTRKVHNDAVKLCSGAAKSTAEFIEEQYYDFLEDYRDKISGIYLENRDDLEKIYKSEIEFESFEDKTKYYNDLVSDIFPPATGFGLSYETLERKNNYTLLIQYIDLVAISEDMICGRVFFYDEENGNIVYLIDSTSDSSFNYKFPCSVEKPNSNMLQNVFGKDDPAPYFEDQFCYAYSPIVVGEGDDDSVDAYVGYYLSNERMQSSQRWFILSILFIMLGATAVISVFYIVFADRLIIRNIRKLTKDTETFTEKMQSGSDLKPVFSEIKTRDELGDLSEKFNLMQTSIAGYVARLAEKTASEERLKAELDVAAKIQSEALPSEPLYKGGVNVSSFLRPAKEVGGDFYDYFTLKDGSIFFYIADVTGKGVPAALFMMRSKELIKSKVSDTPDLPALARDVNNALCEGNSEGLFITAFFGMIDKKDHKMKYLRAGHEQPFLRRAGRVRAIAEESNFIIGAFENMDYVEEELVLEPGDGLLLYTDGLNEGINESFEEFGYDRISEILLSNRAGAPEKLFSELTGFAGNAEQFDDVTMIYITIDDEDVMTLHDPSVSDIPVITDRIFERLAGFDADKVSETGIIIDEILNNCISYAFKETSEPVIRITLTIAGDDISLVFADNGFPFDPLASAPGNDSPDPSEDWDGGAGLLLVRGLSDKVSYVYSGGENRLTVHKNMRP